MKIMITNTMRNMVVSTNEFDANESGSHKKGHFNKSFAENAGSKKGQGTKQHHHSDELG